MSHEKTAEDIAAIRRDLEVVRQATERASDAGDRCAAAMATTVLNIKRSDQQHANRMMRFEAALQQPAVLADIVPKGVLDEARQIARKRMLTSPSNGETPMTRRRDDEISRVFAIQIGPNVRLRLTKRRIAALAAVVTAVVSHVLAHYGIHF